MIQEQQRLAVKNLIETGNIKELKEVFIYVKKLHLHEQMGINYNRFLRIINNPKKFQYEDAYQLASIFKVTPLQISTIIHNQIDNSKTVQKTKKIIKKKKST